MAAGISLTPGDYMVRTPAPGRLEHFVAYLGTGAVASVGYGRRVSSLQIAGLLWVYAALLEIGQNWAPGCHPQFMDFAIGAAGAVAGSSWSGFGEWGWALEPCAGLEPVPTLAAMAWPRVNRGISAL